MAVPVAIATLAACHPPGERRYKKIVRFATLDLVKAGWMLKDKGGLPRDKVHRFQEILNRYGSIGASPYRVDTVGFLLETPQGLWSAQLPFKPKGVSKKCRTFGTPELTLSDEMHGRFVGLLPVKDGG